MKRIGGGGGVARFWVVLTLSLPWASIVAQLRYPLTPIYSNREYLGNPRESHEIEGICSIMLRGIPITHI